MSATVLFRHEGNLGYGADQVRANMTLGELLEAVQEAIVEWGEDANVVTYQTNNRYGANYGSLSGYDLFAAANNDDDEEDEE